jgi:hypothetical protein
MEENETKGMDERTFFLNKAIGVSLFALGIYGLLYAYKIYKAK